MKKRITASCLGLAALLWTTPAWADSHGASVEETLRTLNERIRQLEGEVARLKQQEAPPAEAAAAPDAAAMLDKRVSALESGLGLLKGVEFGGMAYASYNYNFNTPDEGGNDLRIFDVNHNDFTLDLVQLEVSKQTDSGVGFHTVLDYGKTAGLIQSDWGGELAHNFEIQQAYATYTWKIGRGLDMQFGKFATLLGGEVIESPYNPNISRSFMFGYAIPFTHTGALFSYPLTDMLSLSAGVVNGWDNVVDNNNGKTFLGSLGLEVGNLTWTFSGVFGPEEDDRGGSKTGVFDTVLTYTPMDNIDLLVNFDYGTASDVLGMKNATWTGLSGIITLGGSLLNPAWENWSLALRGEWFADNQNYRLGIDDNTPGYSQLSAFRNEQMVSKESCAADAYPRCQVYYTYIPGAAGPFNENLNTNLWEITGTLKWQMTDNFQARLEYRHDGANQRVFGKNGGYKKSQNTMILEFAYLL